MRLVLVISVMLALSTAAWAEVISGPKVGDKLPALPVYAVTGEPKEKDLDYAKERDNKPTVYVFVQAEHWGRPMFRFVKKLDEVIPNESKEAAVVAVWLGEKPDQN